MNTDVQTPENESVATTTPIADAPSVVEATTETSAPEAAPQDTTEQPVAPAQAAQPPMIVEERLLAAAYINQAIQKDGLLPHVIVMTGFRYGGVVRTMIAWAPQGQLTPESVASAMNIAYDPKQGDFIHIEMITSANALIGIPDTSTLTVVRSAYQIQQQTAPAPEATNAVPVAPVADAMTTPAETVSTEPQADVSVPITQPDIQHVPV